MNEEMNSDFNDKELDGDFAGRDSIDIESFESGGEADRYGSSADDGEGRYVDREFAEDGHLEANEDFSNREKVDNRPMDLNSPIRDNALTTVAMLNEAKEILNPDYYEKNDAYSINDGEVYCHTLGNALVLSSVENRDEWSQDQLKALSSMPIDEYEQYIAQMKDPSNEGLRKQSDDIAERYSIPQYRLHQDFKIDKTLRSLLRQKLEMNPRIHYILEDCGKEDSVERLEMQNLLTEGAPALAPVVKQFLSLVDNHENEPTINQLGDEQKDILLYHPQRHGGLVVDANPGSGKTHVLKDLYFYLHDRFNVDYNNITVLSFTKAGAQEIEDRIKKMANGAINEKYIHVSTIDSLANDVIRRYSADLFPEGNTPRLLAEENKAIEDDIWNKIALNMGMSDKARELKDLVNRAISNGWTPEIDEMNTHKLPEDVRENINHIETAINTLLEDFLLPRDILTDAYWLYDEIKVTGGLNNSGYRDDGYRQYIDYNDMKRIAMDFLNDNPRAAGHYHNMAKIVIVDECQDNSRLQNDFVDIIVHPQGMVYDMGDRKQCIYGKLGADQDGIKNLANRPNVARRQLVTSYRFRNSRISDAADAFAKASGICGQDYKGSQLPEGVGVGRTPELWQCNSEVDEVKAAMQVIKDKILAVPEGDRRKVASSFAILCRENGNRSDENGLRQKALVEAMFRADPVLKQYLPSSNALTEDSDEVNRMLDSLRTVLDTINAPKDMEKFNHLIDLFNGGRKQLELPYLKEKDMMKDKNCVDAYEKLLMKSNQRFDRANTLVEKYRDVMYMTSAADVLDTFWATKSNTVKRIHRDLNIYNFTRQEAMDKIDILRSDKAYEIEVPDAQKGITISTMHGSKGHEYDNVFILFQNERNLQRLMPKNAGQLSKESTMTSEEDLLYVAFTRAKDNVFMSYSGTRNPLLNMFSDYIDNVRVELKTQKNRKNAEPTYVFTHSEIEHKDINPVKRTDAAAPAASADGSAKTVEDGKPAAKAETKTAESVKTGGPKGLAEALAAHQTRATKIHNSRHTR